MLHGAARRPRGDREHRLGDGPQRVPAVRPLRGVEGGLIALSRVLARELGGDGVRVNAIAPGFTLTDASRALIEDADTYGVARGAIQRSLQPDDIVGTALFLASDAAAMVTGQTVVVDGGRQFL